MLDFACRAVSVFARSGASHDDRPGALEVLGDGGEVENRSQRQKPAALVGVTGPGRKPSQVGCRVVRQRLHRSSHWREFPSRPWNQ